MGVKFARGLAWMTGRSILALNAGLYAILRLAMGGMRVLGAAMGVEPARIEHDLAILQLVGEVVIFFLMLKSLAAIFCAMGRTFQSVFAGAQCLHYGVHSGIHH